MSWAKFQRSVTKTPCLRPGGINLFPHPFLGQYRTTLAMKAQQSQAGKNFKTDFKRAAVELWRAGVPLATIRKQLKMSEFTLRRILADARKNPTLPVEEVGFPQNLVVGLPTRFQEAIAREGGMTRYETDCKKRNICFFQLLHCFIIASLYDQSILSASTVCSNIVIQCCKTLKPMLSTLTA